MLKIRALFHCFMLSIFSLLLSGCVSVTTPVKNQYSEEQISLSNGEYTVPGILTTPVAVAGKKFPVIVMLHGTASQKNEVGDLYQRLAVYLAHQGYASLRIDFAGTGDSPVDYRFYNLTSATRDTKAALDYLARQNRFDADRLGLIGFSQGGLIAQLVAAQDDRVSALVTWSSVASNGIDVFQFMFDQYYVEAEKNGFAVVHFPWRPQPLNFGLQWFNEIKANTSLTDMKNYQGPLLAVAGEADTLVPYTSSLKLLQAVGSDSASFYLVKGADHMFNVLGNSNENGLAADQSTAEELLRVTSEWFASTL